jgi:hypothetical protein
LFFKCFPAKNETKNSLLVDWVIIYNNDIV